MSTQPREMMRLIRRLGKLRPDERLLRALAFLQKGDWAAALPPLRRYLVVVAAEPYASSVARATLGVMLIALEKQSEAASLLDEVAETALERGYRPLRRDCLALLKTCGGQELGDVP